MAIVGQRAERLMHHRDHRSATGSIGDAGLT